MKKKKTITVAGSIGDMYELLLGRQVSVYTRIAEEDGMLSFVGLFIGLDDKTVVLGTSDGINVFPELIIERSEVVAIHLKTDTPVSEGDSEAVH